MNESRDGRSRKLTGFCREQIREFTNKILLGGELWKKSINKSCSQWAIIIIKFCSMHFSMLRKDNNPLCKFSTFNRAESIWGKSSLIAARDCTTIRNLYANGYCFCVDWQITTLSFTITLITRFVPMILQLIWVHCVPRMMILEVVASLIASA